MAINVTEQRVLDRVDPQRITDLTLELIKIPSPTGQEAEVAAYYASYLKGIGLEVELDYEYPNSPTVLAWLKGNRERPVLQIVSHTDTVFLEHPPPCYRDGFIYGRGACDFKSGLAAMAEAARAIQASGVELEGTLLLTGYGMHERPGAKKESIISLAQSDRMGDAVIVVGAGEKGVPVAQKGLVIFDLRISREGPTLHEKAVTPEAVHPLWAGWRALQALKERSEQLAKTPPGHPYLEPDSLFVGMFEGGEFFNTLPTSCRIWGTRRWGPGISYADIESEFEGLAAQLEQETGTTVHIDLDKVGEAAAVSEEEPVVRLIQSAAQDVTGEEWPVTGTAAAGDFWIFRNIGNVPCTYHSADVSRAHSTPEYVELSQVVQAAKVYALATLRYAGYQDT